MKLEPLSNPHTRPVAQILASSSGAMVTFHFFVMSRFFICVFCAQDFLAREFMTVVLTFEN